MEFSYFTINQIKLQSFIMIPNALMEVPCLKEISNDAKLLYGVLLSRTYLSIENEWKDEQGRVYVICTNEQIQEKMNCANKKAGNILTELEAVGLIERKKQGGQKADIIYVKNYLPADSSPNYSTTNYSSLGTVACQNDTSYCMACDNDTSRHVKTTPPDVSKTHASYIDSNYKDNSYNSFIRSKSSSVEPSDGISEDEDDNSPNDTSLPSPEYDSLITEIIDSNDHFEAKLLCKEALRLVHTENIEVLSAFTIVSAVKKMIEIKKTRHQIISSDRYLKTLLNNAATKDADEYALQEKLFNRGNHNTCKSNVPTSNYIDHLRKLNDFLLRQASECSHATVYSPTDSNTWLTNSNA